MNQRYIYFVRNALKLTYGNLESEKFSGGDAGYHAMSLMFKVVTHRRA